MNTYLNYELISTLQSIFPIFLPSILNPYNLPLYTGSSESSNSPSNGCRAKSPGHSSSILTTNNNNNNPSNHSGVAMTTTATTVAPPTQRRLGTYNDKSRVGSSVGDSGDDDSSLSDNAASNTNTTPIGTLYYTLFISNII